MIDHFLKKRRDDLQEYLGSLHLTHMLTLNYRIPLSGGRENRHRTLTTHLRRWNRDVLEGMFGKKFMKHNHDDAFFFAAFIEVGVLYRKDHLHVLVRVPVLKSEWFERKAVSLWDSTADVVMKRIFDETGAIRYCTKDIARHPDWLVLSNEFKRAAG